MKTRPRQTPEIPLASTSDVAFLLLIFFLVAASSGQDKGLPLDLPWTEKSQAITETQNVEIEIKPDGLTIAGQPLAEGADLVQTIRGYVEGKTDPQERVVLITCEDSVSYQRWTDVVSAVEQAGGIPAPQIVEEVASPGQ